MNERDWPVICSYNNREAVLQSRGGHIFRLLSGRIVGRMSFRALNEEGYTSVRFDFRTRCGTCFVYRNIFFIRSFFPNLEAEVEGVENNSGVCISCDLDSRDVIRVKASGQVLEGSVKYMRPTLCFHGGSAGVKVHAAFPGLFEGWIAYELTADRFLWKPGAKFRDGRWWLGAQDDLDIAEAERVHPFPDCSDIVLVKKPGQATS